LIHFNYWKVSLQYKTKTGCENAMLWTRLPKSLVVAVGGDEVGGRGWGWATNIKGSISGTDAWLKHWRTNLILKNLQFVQISFGFHSHTTNAKNLGTSST